MRQPAFSGRRAVRRRRASAFSLIEVMFSLVVVGGGLVSVFGLFPVGLRQGMSARGDMAQATFASTVLETIAANVRSIDNLEDWEDFSKWWRVATTGSTSGSKNNFASLKTYTAQQFANASGAFTLRTREKAMAPDSKTGVPKVLETKDTNGKFGDNCVWYACREEFETDKVSSFKNNDLVLPPQLLVRIVKVERYARGFNRINSTSKGKIDWDTAKSDDKTSGGERVLVPPSKGVGVVNLFADDDGGVEIISEQDGEDTQGNDNIRLPSRYLVSIVSSDLPAPQAFVENPVFFQEYAFLHRP